MRFIDFLLEIDDVGTRTQGPSGSTTSFTIVVSNGINKKKKRKKQN